MTIDLQQPEREPSESSLVEIEPVIRARDLWHSFGEHPVLEGISFNVEPGEILGVVGPQGAGKTTLLRILATLLEPERGSVQVHGHDSALEPEQARTLIGYLPNPLSLYEPLTVAEYLDFFARLQRPVPAHRIGPTLELTGLERLKNHGIDTLSKTERQRLGLARALLHDPAVLILDEPASNWDPSTRAELQALLSGLSKQGKAIVLSSSSPSDLGARCDRVKCLGTEPTEQQS